jgi:hypothetical protein
MYNENLKKSELEYKPKIKKIVKETKKVLESTGMKDKINIVHAIYFSKPELFHNEPYCYYINANNPLINLIIIHKINENPVYLDLKHFNKLGNVDIIVKIIYNNSGIVYESDIYKLKL